MKKKGCRNALIIFVVVLVFIAGAIAIFVNKSNESFEKLSAMSIENVDLSTIPNGEYLGAYNLFPISVEVEVTVSNHRLTDITIVKHVNGQGGPAESIVDVVLEKQSLEVDAISGATYSSKVILKSIEDALLSQMPTNK
jgi:uncharacterized protein with FMN-binding domain